ncbi:MAG TPA: glycosyltransferase [Anaerolineales bacterium]
MLSYHTCPLATLGGKDTGGMNVYVRDLTRELGRSGVHVDVFTRSQDEHVPHIVHELGFGNRVVHVPAGPEYPVPKQQLIEHVPEFSRGVLAFAESKNIHYDLIHSHYWLSGMAAQTLVGAWPGTPIVQMFHTLGEMKNRVAQSDEEREGPERIRAEKRLVDQVDRIVVSTLAEQTQLRFLYKADERKLEIIPPGVDIAHFYPIPADEAKAFVGLKPDDRMVLFVGRIERLKGLETLIRAMSRLKLGGEGRPVHLAIIGGEPDASPDEITSEMRRLQQLCDELGLDQTVLFLGKRAQDTLQYYYSAAEVVVLPSHYESFGLVALEAMACGTPVIASDVGGLSFLVQDGETGFTVPDGDVEFLLARLSMLLGDPDLRRRMGAAGTRYARDFSWDRITKQVAAVYRELTAVRER